jgi:nucleolar GTP-binding protein
LLPQCYPTTPKNDCFHQKTLFTENKQKKTCCKAPQTETLINLFLPVDDMNLQGLSKVETAQTFLDIAFKAARDTADQLRQKKKTGRMDKIAKSKMLEKQKISTIAAALHKAMDRILKGFPNFTELSQFYQELVRIELDYVEFKRGLGACRWAQKKTDTLHREYNRKIDSSFTIEHANKHRREFYGRVSSFMKQINKQLLFLDTCRRQFKDFPTIKESLPTVCFFGFPNVGKSTLLAKISSATPEIKAYAFTTKKLNLGYIKEPKKKIQLIDTPGTLNRFERMNKIEKQAYLALKHCANLVVFVFDPTDTYDYDKQFSLLASIEKFKVPIVVYISKTDIADKERVEVLHVQFKEKKIKHVLSNDDELKAYLVKKV